MKRYEVRITTNSPVIAAICVITKQPLPVTVRQYRWRWRARWACWCVNNLPPPLPPSLFGFQSATWRPILRVVESKEHAA